MLHRFELTVVFSLAVVFHAQASHLALPHEEGVVQNARGDSLSYSLMLPPGHDNPDLQLPLILYLHGAGVRGTDNRAQFTDAQELLNVTQGQNSMRTILCQRDPICIAGLEGRDEQFASYVLAPQAPPGTRWIDFLDVMHTMIEDFSSVYNIDQQRIYTMGFSMGGFGVFDMLEAYPQQFAAGIPISGGGDPSAVEVYKEVPTWLFHGEFDSVVPPSLSVEMHDALTAVGSDSQLTIVPGGEHLILAGVLRDIEYDFYEWMFSQTRVPEPGGIALSVVGGLLWLTSGRATRRRIDEH